ncbi:MAG: hypothetical protein ABEH86_04100 [Haloarcula sp.]
MGDPITYLFVEPVVGCEDAVWDAVEAWQDDWSSVSERAGTVASRHLGTDVERARSVIEDLGDAVDRALVLTLNDATAFGVGEGRLFDRATRTEAAATLRNRAEAEPDAVAESLPLLADLDERRGEQVLAAIADRSDQFESAQNLREDADGSATPSVDAVRRLAATLATL